MQKRFVAMLLAVLMLLGCATTAFAAENTYQISSAKDLALLAQHPGATFEITKDIDFASAKWAPIGTAAQPFTGTINGNDHEIDNIVLTDAAVGGLFAYFAGTLKDLTFYNVQATITNAALFGGVAASNTGTIQNVRIQLADAKITTAPSAMLGQIAAVNTGTIEDVISGMDLNVTAKQGTKVGGLCATTSGKISGSNAAGRLIVTGDATVGLLVNELPAGQQIETSRFTGSMAKLNDELLKNMCATKGYKAKFVNCLWRDNKNSLELIEGEEREMRDTILTYSHLMTTTVWTASKDLDMVELNADSASSRGHDKHYKAGETWYGMQYSHKFKGLAAFLYCFNEDGTFKDFVTDGADAYDMYFTNDCSAATINSLQTISPTLECTGATNSIPNYSYGDIADNHSRPVGYKVNPNNLTSGSSKKFYDYNGRDVMAEAWSCAEPGDGATSVNDGHSRLYTGSMILRDENGKIDQDESIVMMNGMGDGITRRIYHVDYEDDGLYQMSVLLDKYWLPYTTEELIDGHKPEAKYKLTGVDTFDRAHLCSGVIETNYGMLNVKLELLNKDGSKAFEKILWQRVYKWDANGGDDYARRVIRKFDMSDFATSLVGAKLTEGKTYTAKITVLLSDLNEYEVKTYDFVY